MSSTHRPARPVQTWPCQSVCIWEPTGETWVDAGTGDLQVFSCAGCGSEWVRTEPWTPVDSGGMVPTPVAAEAHRRSGKSKPSGQP